MKNVQQFRKMKQEGQPIAMLTAYDYPSAQIVQRSGADLILVGDSLGNVVQGHTHTIFVKVEHVVYHAQAVGRGAPDTFIVADMPFMSYHGSIETSLKNVQMLVQDGCVQAVKMEGGEELCPLIKACVEAGVPVMGHIGLQPQSVHQLGGYKVQGKSSSQAEALLMQAKALEEAGAFAIVAELITADVAKLISEQLEIPVIGIGAGKDVDGQILVFHDVLQYGLDIRPKKFVKTYCNVGEDMKNALQQYVHEVKGKQFPEEKHIFK